MTLLQPLALVGLLAAAIPPLLHLLQRRSPPVVTFPGLRYLSAAERQSARRIRLHHLLLLVLRTALVVTVVLAAARPLIPAPAGGVHAPTAFVVVLDNSPSAGAVRKGHPVLEELRTAARRSLLDAQVGDRAWVMLADGVARAGPPAELLAVIDSARVAPQRLDLTAAVERAGRLVAAEPLPSAEIHVFSDLQRTALAGGSADVPPAVRVLVLRASPPGLVNRGVGAVQVVDGAVRVSITGTPDAAAVPVAVRLVDHGRELGRALAAPGDAFAVTLPPVPVGWWVGEVELEADELRADDRRLFAWRVAPPAAISASPGLGPFLDAALAVLREAGRVSPGHELTIGDRPGSGHSVVMPPRDPAQLGQTNRALAVRGVPWRVGASGAPGIVASAEIGALDGSAVSRRQRLEPTGPAAGAVLATVGGEPWLVRAGNVVLLGSRMDTAWSGLPTTPGFVPFVDALVNRVARGELVVRHVEGSTGARFERQGADTVGVTLSGPDPRESDLAPAGAALVRATLAAEDVVDEAGLATARFAGARRSEGAGLLLALALVLAVVELGVAWRTR